MNVVLVLSLFVCCAISTSVLPESVLEAWRIIPSNTPENISNETALANITRFVSPLLSGGLGNIVFEIASCYVVGKKNGIPCIVAWWDQTKPRNPYYRKYHGRRDPAPGISLKHIFPNITFVDFEPSHRNAFKQAYRQNYYKYFKGNLWKPDRPFLDGTFFDPRYYHHERDYLVNHVLQFHPVMIEYLKSKYSAVLYGPREPVSVHFRSNSPDEPDKKSPQHTTYPSHNWHLHIMQHIFSPPNVTFLVFTDNVPVIQALLDRNLTHPDVQYQIIQEDFANSLALMTLCKHHIVAVSSFSFMGAYLDPRQPSSGRTIVAPKYTKIHEAALPFSEWEVIPEPVV